MSNNYKEAIFICFSDITKDGKVSWDDFVEKLSETIINDYADQDLSLFKGQWRMRFTRYAQDNQLEVVPDTKDTWANLQLSLEAKNKTQTKTCRSSSSKPTNSSSATTTATTSTATSTNKNMKLCHEEKLEIIAYFNSIKEQDKWILSNGIVVEDIMKKLANNSDFEHPSHSLIFDPIDQNLQSYFSKDELNEIMAYNHIPLPRFPYNDFFDAFNSLTSPTDIYQAACKMELDLMKDKDLVWMRDTLMNIAKLYAYQEFPPKSTSSEAYLSHVVWSFVYDAFFGSNIDILVGEKSSKASATRKNGKRKLETSEAREGYLMGSKMDIIYCLEDIEIGGAEFGRFQSSSTTDKQFGDGLVKLPKLLKDMLCEIVRSRPDLLNKVKVVGFLTMGFEIQMLIMDVPVKKTARLSRTNIFTFPKTANTLIDDVKRLFQLVWKAKSVMSTTEELIKSHRPQDEHQEEIDTIICLQEPMLLPSFNRHRVKANKKRNTGSIEA